jgi:hypothetical protein
MTTFGIEIECGIPWDTFNAKDLKRGTYHDGDEIGDPFPARWKLEADGSLSGSDDFVWCEIVSPPLELDQAGIGQVVQVFEILKAWGFKTNRTCGLHVHIGIESVVGRDPTLSKLSSLVRRVLCFTARHETALFALTGSRHVLDNRYCHSVKNEWGRSTTREDKEDQIEGVESRIYGDHDWRYYTVNMMNIWKTRTIEFRVFRGTTSINKAVGYILTAAAICKRANTVKTAVRWDSQNHYDFETRLSDMHKALGWDPGVRQKRPSFGPFVPPEIWAEWGDKVLANQAWNAKKLKESYRS